MKGAQMMIYVRGAGYFTPVDKHFKQLEIGEYIRSNFGQVYQYTCLSPVIFTKVEAKDIKSGVRVAEVKFLK